METTINSLPKLPLVLIFEKLDLQSVGRVCAVCKRWNETSKEKQIWVKKLEEEGVGEKEREEYLEKNRQETLKDLYRSLHEYSLFGLSPLFPPFSFFFKYKRLIFSTSTKKKKVGLREKNVKWKFPPEIKCVFTGPTKAGKVCKNLNNNFFEFHGKLKEFELALKRKKYIRQYWECV